MKLFGAITAAVLLTNLTYAKVSIPLGSSQNCSEAVSKAVNLTTLQQSISKEFKDILKSAIIYKTPSIIDSPDAIKLKDDLITVEEESYSFADEVKEFRINLNEEAFLSPYYGDTSLYDVHESLRTTAVLYALDKETNANVDISILRTSFLINNIIETANHEYDALGNITKAAPANCELTTGAILITVKKIRNADTGKSITKLTNRDPRKIDLEKILLNSLN